MSKWLVRFVRNDEGQDLVEYAFLIVFIALVALTGIRLLGTDLSTFYQALGAAMPSPVIP